MKIKTKTLVNFLKKTRLDGTQIIEEAIINFDSEGIKINANSSAQQARVMAWLKTNAFEKYEAIGKVGINDLTNIIKVLDRFSEYISISKEGNLLTIKGDNKKVDIELVSEGFLASDTGEPKITFDETFTMTANQLRDVYKDVQINKDAVITIKTIEKKVMFENTGKYKFLNEFNAPTCKGGITSVFGNPLIDCTINLDGTLEMNLKNDFPIKIREATDVSVITLIIAPRV